MENALQSHACRYTIHGNKNNICICMYILSYDIYSCHAFLFLQHSQYQYRYLVLLYHQYHQMIKLDFEFFYPFEVLNTSN